MKTIAIIIPAYNAEKYIRECLKSIHLQYPSEGWDYDIRVGVDGCKNTAKVLDKMNFPYYYSYNNVGAYVMRNSLMLIKPADIYVYFDADDVMYSVKYIKICIDAILQGHEIVMPSKYQCDENLELLKSAPVFEQGGAMCFTHRILDLLGGFYNARCASDTDFMHRAEMAGYKIYKIPQGLYMRRRHNQSLTKSGLTIHGGKYRKEVWQKMTADRENGIVKIIPRVTELEFKDVR